jgi:hypothetical protein
MKAKLIKVENTFYLKQGETILATSSIPNLSASIRYSLSKQNCEAIANGYDVYELAKENYHKFWPIIDESGLINHTFGYVEGFNKAMELNKDKVFTLEDVKRAIRFGFDVGFCSNSDNKLKRLGLSEDEFIQSLKQPTEIDVEIEMECCGNYSPPCNINCEYGGKPKLDSEGQLILKKI